MNSYADRQTEKSLAELEARIRRIYSEAGKEMQQKATEYFDAFSARDKAQQSLVASGKLTGDQYKQWRLAQIGRGKRYEALRDQLAERANWANQVAAAAINKTLPDVYAMNRNYAAYTIEQVGGDIGFTLWDESTVNRMLTNQPDLMPYYPPKRAVKRRIDLAYGKRQITAQVTSSLLTGESIGKVADHLQQRISGMNRASAVRAARTSVTAAQNGGRMDSYAQAEQLGITVRKRWIATKDERTRTSHAELDGEIVPWDKPFSNGLMYPGDPNGPPAETYNCRCRMATAEKDGIEAEPRMMRVRDPSTGQNKVIPQQSYQDWKRQKDIATQSKSDIMILEGENLSMDVAIDRFTPCLFDRETGKNIDTEYGIASPRELSGLKKKGWLFNWRDSSLKKSEVYKLTLRGDSTIQGLIAIEQRIDNSAYHLSLAESAPHNKGESKRFDGVGGHLFAIAVQKSNDAGFGGFVYFEAKNKELVSHYEEKFGACLIGFPHPYSMVIDEEAAQRLLSAYTLEGGD